MEEDNESICVGQRISVNVETVFKEGLVVSFTDADGLEYRGALLSPVVGSGRSQCRLENVVCSVHLGGMVHYVSKRWGHGRYYRLMNHV